ncbi:U1 small nuclear ribonucleoprotein component SNU71 [Candida albicans L26]|uniref:U1 small nuclear ribonucleoprotein component SNU71 n=1 Tax=Candida albicans P78048 TaxID=1094989 RepID=A0AB34PWH0_CANAX|nr:U1 small nuclear ribonucleoprotein component SNU71 [Candida albicans P78048]KGU16057.1 U1 small nuclear ribonucleoprotein component SNU71 [Candida albicans 19F]KGU16251.1 U1 small nuclear ribonucleoprotein component SNU71 [Candida albicans L26]
MTAGDNSIEYVNPYSLSQTINSDLISILDPNGSTTSIIKPQLNYQIPIFKSIDVSNLIDLNNTKIQTQTNETRINKAKDSSDDHQNNPSSKDYDTSGENIVGGIDDIVEDIKLYVSIDKLKPENFQNQLTTIIINQFPTNLKSNLIEQLLKMLMNLKKFVWSFINHELIDLKLIFIKFDQLKDLKWFLLTYCDHISQLIPNVTIITNDKVNEYLNNNKDSSLAKVEPSKITDNLKAKINLIINNPINYTKGKKNSGTEDLDQVLDSYSNYKVDNNDLIDIPNNMKENIIKDIIRFRSRMLLIEKEQRKKEIEMERIKTKNKLKELFEGIKENSTDSTTRKATNKAAVGVTISPKVSHRDEYEDMNDKEYEEFIAVEERNKLNDQYNKKLKSFQNNQHAEYIKLTNKLKSLQNYESDLIDNKLKYIDNLKNYQTNGLAHLYTHNYSDYLRMRSQKRSLEETKDAEDVKQELEEIKKNGGQVASTNTNTNTKPSTYSSGVSELATTSVETPKSTTTTTTTNDTTDEPVAKKSKLAKEIIIIDLPPTVKQSLQEKIVELVENSLGIKDEFLIQVINENLEASNLDNKQELIDELVQVLDEDAESLVNELWDYIETMV